MTSCRLPKPEAVLRAGSENYHQYLVWCDFDRDTYHEAYYQIEFFFKNVTQDQFLKPFMDFQSFESYPLYVFDLTYQKEHASAKPSNVEFVIRGNTNSNI